MESFQKAEFWAIFLVILFVGKEKWPEVRIYLHGKWQTRWLVDGRVGRKGCGGRGIGSSGTRKPKGADTSTGLGTRLKKLVLHHSAYRRPSTTEEELNSQVNKKTWPASFSTCNHQLSQQWHNGLMNEVVSWQGCRSARGQQHGSTHQVATP